MIIIQQILLGILFLLVSILCFTFPGSYLLKIMSKLFPSEIKSDLNDNLEKFIIYTVFGMVIFTLSAYILTAVNLRFIMYIFPLLGILYLVKFGRFLNVRLNIRNKLFFLSVLIIGIVGQVAVNAPSGFLYKEGIYFYSSHGHDGVWHLSLMEEMHKNNFPFQNPELSGAKLQNYHFFVDLLMSEFSRLFHFSNLDIYFRFMPVVFSLLLGLSGFIFVRFWASSELSGIWAMIFTYFAGSFGYILSFIKNRTFFGETTFWVSQTQSVLGNPPHAAAFIITTTFLFTLLKYLKTSKLLYFLLCSFLGGAVIEFKVYAGVLILVGLLVLGIFELFSKKEYRILFLFITTAFISLIIYLPNSANSQDFLIWQPWWYIRTMVVVPDRLGWLDLELKRQTYIAEHNLKRVIQVETIAFLIFLIGNLGMRFIGFWTVIKQIKGNIFKNSFNLFFMIITAISFLIPVFFLQKGVAWNSIQFNQYFLLFFGFFASISTVGILQMFKTKHSKLIISILIILLAVPTQIGLLWQFYSNKPLSKISKEEIEALNFLKHQKEGIVLVASFNKYERDRYKDPPIPIYSWYDTGYVPAFSGKRTLISDQEQIDIMGYKISGLLEEREKIFENSNNQDVNNFLKKYKVGFIYLAWDQQLKAENDKLNADLIFRNKDARIYKVRN